MADRPEDRPVLTVCPLGVARRPRTVAAFAAMAALVGVSGEPRREYAIRPVEPLPPGLDMKADPRQYTGARVKLRPRANPHSQRAREKRRRRRVLAQASRKANRR